MDYLPLGSVVRLKGSDKQFLIFGRKVILNNDSEKDKEIFDYFACPYPEGYIDYKKNIVFNADKIKEIVFRGYSDKEEKVYWDILKEVGNRSEKVNSV